MFSDRPVSPAAAFHIGVAEDKKTDGVDMFGSPAYGDVELHDADDNGTIQCVDHKGSQFQTEGCLCASCTRDCLKEHHGSDSEQV